MRVGFITQLLWPRYGDFWVKLVTGAGLEPIYAAPDDVRRALRDERLGSVPGVAFRLAAAQALALEADVIVAPDLNPGASTARGSAQDPFIANFPEALTTLVGGLPSVVGVPASLAGGLETLAVSTLHSLVRDPGLVRRVWERHRTGARAPRVPEPKWRVRPAEGGTVGLVGQPWLLREALERLALARVAPPGGFRHAVSQRQLDPSLLQKEGGRLDDRLLPTDAEALGAVRLLSRKGSVTELLMLADRTSSADAWLLGRAQRLVHKPFAVVYVQELEGAEDTLLG
jgi:hypothetical protein